MRHLLSISKKIKIFHTKNRVKSRGIFNTQFQKGRNFVCLSIQSTGRIKMHGDWKSDCYQQYLSFSLEDKLVVVSKMKKSILSI